MVRQAEFLLGPVGVVDGGLRRCRGCGYDLPPDARICPACGFERTPYPAGTFQRFRWVFEQEIDATAKLVLLALVSHDMPGGGAGLVFPSQERLARMTGLGRRSVINALNRLERGGWIAREKTRRRGRQASNQYVIGPQYRVHEVHSDRVHEVHTKE